MVIFFFFKQKTAYEMRISDWSSDVCSSDRIGGVVADRLRHLGENDGERFGHVLRFRRNPPEFNRRPICGRLWGGEIPSLSLVSRHDGQIGKERSEERRVGKECGSTGRSRWSPYH